MYPSKTPNLDRRLLESHPFPIDFSTPPNQASSTVATIHQGKQSQNPLLPPELWVDIFLYCLPELPRPDSSNPSIPVAVPWYCRDLYVNPLTAPLLLCRICRLWRQIALNLPRLWSRLVVFVSLGSVYPSMDLAKLWLSRSGTHPLSLSLYQQNDSNVNRRLAGRVLGLFVHHASRWMDIQFHVSGPRLGLCFISDESRAPLLQRFVLSTHSRVYEKEEKYIFGIFEDVPRLSHLHVSRIPELDILGKSGLVTVPWNQLESLSLDYVPSVGTCLHILKNCGNLREGRIGVDLLFGPVVDEPFSHPVLQSLSINISKEHFAGFVTRLSLPGLQRLAVQVRVNPLEEVDHGWPHREFEAFLERSFRSPRASTTALSSPTGLTRLELVNSGMRVDQFVRSILGSRYIQALEELVLVDNHDHRREQWNQAWNSSGPFVTDAGVGLLNYPRLRDAYSAIVFFHQPGGAGSQGLTPTIAPTISNPSNNSSPPSTIDSDDSDSGSMTASNDWDAGKVTCFLPKLVKLVVRGNSCLRTSDGIVADMVESRWYQSDAALRPAADVSQLKSVILDIPSGNLMDLQRLRALQARGLDLVLGFIE